MVGHQHKGMQAESLLPAIPIQCLQEKSGVRFHDEEPSALKGREGYEVSSGRRHRSCRFHSAGPQRLKAESLSQPNAVRLEVAPFPVALFSNRSSSGKLATCCHASTSPTPFAPTGAARFPQASTAPPCDVQPLLRNLNRPQLGHAPKLPQSCPESQNGKHFLRRRPH